MNKKLKIISSILCVLIGIILLIINPHLIVSIIGLIMIVVGGVNIGIFLRECYEILKLNLSGKELK